MMIFYWCFYTDELLSLLQFLLYWLYWIVAILTYIVTELGFCCKKNEAVQNIYEALSTMIVLGTGKKLYF